MRSLIRKINPHIMLLLAIGLAFFLIKCHITYKIKYVGHADAAAYAEMADSLIRSRGFEVDYISWYFEKYDPKIIRPEDHWPPLYSIAIAPFFAAFGKTAFAAKLPSLIISCFLLPLVIFAMVRQLCHSKFAGLAAGVCVMVYPFMFRSSLYCLSDVMFAFVVCALVLFAMKSLDDDKAFYYTGIFLGLAYYAKGSGLLLIPSYALFHVIAKRSIKKVIFNKKFLTSLLITFLILLPWLIRNYIHFRDPLYSTQRFAAGYGGYKSWEEGTYDLYWGEKPPPTYRDKLKETFLFKTDIRLHDDLNNETASEALRKEFKNNGISIPKNAAISTKKSGHKWTIVSRDQTYTIKDVDDKLSIYVGGINHVKRMTTSYLKRHLWWIFADIRSSWGKFGGSDFLKAKWKDVGRNAFLTYFVNVPSLLGLFLLWGNRKRHMIWLASVPLILFLSLCWFPIDRMVLPMICLMMALGWATYFTILRFILNILNKIPFKSLVSRFAQLCQSIFAAFNLSINSQIAYLKPIIQKIDLDIMAGLMVCCLAMPVVILSTESVQTAIKKNGYPYRDGAHEWMDMGKWLRENASPDSITMTRNPWELHFYSEQLAIQIPRTTLEKTIGVMRYYKPTYIIPQLNIRPSLKPLVEGKVPGLELVYDNKKIQLYKIDYNSLPMHEQQQKGKP